MVIKYVLYIQIKSAYIYIHILIIYVDMPISCCTTGIRVYYHYYHHNYHHYVHYHYVHYHYHHNQHHFAMIRGKISTCWGIWLSPGDALGLWQKCFSDWHTTWDGKSPSSAICREEGKRIWHWRFCYLYDALVSYDTRILCTTLCWQWDTEIQWNLSITTTSYDTSLSSRTHPGGPRPPGWALEYRESYRMGNYVSSVCINHFTKWKTGNRLHNKGGRYYQVLLYLAWPIFRWLKARLHPSYCSRVLSHRFYPGALHDDTYHKKYWK